MRVIYRSKAPSVVYIQIKGLDEHGKYLKGTKGKSIRVEDSTVQRVFEIIISALETEVRKEVSNESGRSS